MTWQKITINIDDVQHLLLQLPIIIVKSNNPKLPSPLMGQTGRGGITTVYFPPESAPFWSEVLSKFSSVPCDPPNEPTEPLASGM